MKYSKSLGNKICQATANSSIGLRHICEQLNVPYSTVTSWIYDEDHELYKKYARAKYLQLYHLAEEIANIADDSRNDYMEVLLKNGTIKAIQNKETAARTRIRIQARISIITKLAPILHPRRAKKKETHRVITIPSPHRNTPQEQPEVTTPLQIEKVSSSPAPAIPVLVEEERSKKIPKSSPKTTLKHNPDGTFVELDEHGVFVRKSVIYENAGHPYNFPKYNPHTGQHSTL